MIQCGIGVGVGWGGGVLGPSWLHGRLNARFGARLVGLYIGEDQTLSGADIDAWSGRVGSALANTTALRFSQSTINGRTALSSAANTGKSLYNSAAISCKTAISVLSPTLPFDGYQTAVRGSTGEGIVGNSAVSAFYPYTDMVHYVDSTQTRNITAGVHVVEATRATDIMGDVSIGGTHDGATGQSWIGQIGCVILLSDQQSTQERSDTLLDLLRFYRMV